MTKIIGLTGGIATGKSTADKFFERKGIPIIDTDQIAHHIYDPGKIAWKEIKDEFGEQVVNFDQTINRQVLGKIVFSDPDKMQKLNHITHPQVLIEVKNKITEFEKVDTPIVVLDVPLLYESGYENLCDQVIVITLPEKLQIKRLIKRNNLNYEDALKRINSQMPLAQKAKLADYVVDNSGSVNDLDEQLSEVLKKIKEVSK